MDLAIRKAGAEGVIGYDFRLALLVNYIDIDVIGVWSQEFGR